MSNKTVELATELLKLGLSRPVVTVLLSEYPLEDVERQLTYLPFRKAKRPGAFLVEAIRSNYSPPKEFFHATPHPPHPQEPVPLDKGPQQPV